MLTLVQSYLDAEGPPYAPFSFPECGGRVHQVIFVSVFISFQAGLLGFPPVSVFCISVVCLIPSSIICLPAWTPCPASFWYCATMPFIWTVIIGLRVTKDQGPGQSHWKSVSDVKCNISSYLNDWIHRSQMTPTTIYMTVSKLTVEIATGTKTTWQGLRKKDHGLG